MGKESRVLMIRGIRYLHEKWKYNSFIWGSATLSLWKREIQQLLHELGKWGSFYIDCGNKTASSWAGGNEQFHEQGKLNSSFVILDGNIWQLRQHLGKCNSFEFMNWGNRTALSWTTTTSWSCEIPQFPHELEKQDSFFLIWGEYTRFFVNCGTEQLLRERPKYNSFVINWGKTTASSWIGNHNHSKASPWTGEIPKLCYELEKHYSFVVDWGNTDSFVVNCGDSSWTGEIASS